MWTLPCCLMAVWLCELGVLSELGLKSLKIQDVLTATGRLQSLHLRGMWLSVCKNPHGCSTSLLVGCEIKEEGFEALACGISTCTTIKELRCVYQCIMSRAVPFTASRCSLSWNPMTDLDVDRIMRSLSGATALTSLELDCCDISTNGAMLIALMLRQHSSLRHLSMNADPYRYLKDCYPVPALLMCCVCRRPYVGIGSVGVIALCRAIASPICKLRTLR